ncbi:hypothetical protein [Gilvimarinus agarilyticus]|uniref:hypothetical protein n=1 Tax=Gilvimarinus agarilyticus TaxID=679259 RepID=UPI0005A25B5D|nr:hypothetical protein [Gilvimarinus agarilyticus]
MGPFTTRPRPTLKRRFQLPLVILLAALWGLTIGSDAYAAPANAVSNAEQLIAQYTALWHEPDPARRLKTIEQIWSVSGQHQTPRSYSAGSRALNTEITEFQAQFPGATVTAHGVMRTHNHLLFNFTLRGISGAIIVEGVDYMRLDDSGKISHVVGFF